MVCTSKKCWVPRKKRGDIIFHCLRSLTKGYPNCWWNATQMLVVAWRFPVRQCLMDPWCCRCDELRFAQFFGGKRKNMGWLLQSPLGFLAVFGRICLKVLTQIWYNFATWASWESVECFSTLESINGMLYFFHKVTWERNKGIRNKGKASTLKIPSYLRFLFWFSNFGSA